MKHHAIVEILPDSNHAWGYYYNKTLRPPGNATVLLALHPERERSAVLHDPFQQGAGPSTHHGLNGELASTPRYVLLLIAHVENFRSRLLFA